MTDVVIDHVSVRPNIPLADLTTYKVGGPARWFSEPANLEELRSVLEATPSRVPVVVLGRGSNVVISDEGVDGLVIRLGRQFAAIDIRPDGSLVAGAATPLPKVARDAAKAGRAGLSFYVGIPGSVGGAVRMNAGGHGSSTADVLVDAVVLDVPTRELSIRSPDELELAYRHSNLTLNDIVVRASFATRVGDPRLLEQELREITRWRREHQPGGTLNAGSVFKNPEDSSAGALIDGLGLKGKRVGPVSISTVHANFLVATKEAKAADIHRFVLSIRSIVQEKTGILLEPELRFIGSFEQESPPS
jgi:UDP-N-acetylmuramate dehydrogenase